MRKRFLACIIIIIFVFTACNEKVSAPVERQEFHMGTVITERVYGKDAEKAADEVMDKIEQLENQMTINAAGSEIDRLNTQSGRSRVELSKESIYVLQTAKKFSALSGGTFDVTIGPLVKAWGIFTDHPRVPEQGEIEKLLRFVGYNDIEIDGTSAGLKRPGQIADLGGIAKGYAGDAAIEIYKKYGIKSAFVNLGGNVVVLGGKPDGSPWSIGVQNPRAENGTYIGILSVKDKAVVSSGDYERFFEPVKGGKRYHHIIDPRTGYPSESGLIGTTIVADKSIDADALSTATFILGLDEGMKLVNSIKGVEAVFVTSDKKVYATPGLKDSFVFQDESKEFVYVQER